MNKEQQGLFERLSSLVGPVRATQLVILSTLDIEGARELVPRMPDGTPMSDQGLLAGMHKVRVHTKDLPIELRRQSLDWLRQEGYGDIDGGPLPDEVPL